MGRDIDNEMPSWSCLSADDGDSSESIVKQIRNEFDSDAHIRYLYTMPSIQTVGITFPRHSFRILANFSA